MADEYIPMTDSNVTSDGEGASAAVNSKDEQITVAVDENGYESECSSSSRSEENVARSALEIEADTFTRFIERQRVEVMFELRNLRLGERPVTGQPNRERIQTFLNNIQEQQPHTRTPSTRPAVPSAHIADIDALANRRCVSAALGSAAFRRDLENAVRRSIEMRPVAPIQQIPQAPPIPRTFVPMNIEQQDARTWPLHGTPVIREQERPQITQIQPHEPFNIERQERELYAWQTITQLQRETIVLEISDLVHRQLVTSALESDFRTHLEENIFNRLTQGAPPQQEQQQQQQQQQVPVVRTPRLPPVRTHTTTHASASTVDELSSRLDTMQHMLQLMLSMQMDMQRSLRQEIASAVANNSSNTMILSSQPMDAGHCTICLTAIADTVLYRCGHLCVCYMCGLNLREATSATSVKCPVCRAPVVDILRVYRSSRDGDQI